MNASLASIMPQVIGVWCKEEGHEVTFVCYTGFEDLLTELPDDVDVVFIGAFTEAAHTAYALSNLFRERGAITVIGGRTPAATRKTPRVISTMCWATRIRIRYATCCGTAPNTGPRASTSRARQPRTLPGVRERWQFIGPTLKKAPLLKMVPMLGSLGCPYTCAFCIDSMVPYQPWISRYSARIYGSC